MNLTEQHPQTARIRGDLLENCPFPSAFLLWPPFPTVEVTNCVFATASALPNSRGFIARIRGIVAGHIRLMDDDLAKMWQSPMLFAFQIVSIASTGYEVIGPVLRQQELRHIQVSLKLTQSRQAISRCMILSSSWTCL